MAERKRINNSTLLNNSFSEGVKTIDNFDANAPMTIVSDLDSQYDFALTDDIELLNDRKDTANILHKLFKESIFNDGRFEILQDETEFTAGKQNSLIKIPKENIAEVFNYFKDELLKVKKINPIELVIAINEFFEFNYDYVYKKVITPKFKYEILEDYYKNEGFKQKMDEDTTIKLF